jgi:hypothetical protein
MIGALGRKSKAARPQGKSMTSWNGLIVQYGKRLDISSEAE